MISVRDVFVFSENLGAQTLKVIKEFGLFGIFCADIFRTMLHAPLKAKKIIAQMVFVGIDSLPVVVATGATIGGVLALHAYKGLSSFGADQFVGPLVFLAMAREFGPVLSALMVAGRAGSAMTAEIGTMRISEQLDALTTLSININQYLLVPRVIASVITLPFLSMICTTCGVVVGYLISIHTLGINPEVYTESIKATVASSDLLQGFVKAAIFGLLLSLVGCYKGMVTTGGAKGVGKSTTESVVYASMGTLVMDYILTALMTLL
ncbi:ABC transporter permease [Candidatus Dependentiae bacterium]|nr:ABC transporter permease [Candidatus Dependentiae bacterium]